MNYFLTSYFNETPSAIEIAEIRRLRLFDQIGEPATIVTASPVWDSNYTLDQLGISQRVINMYHYYQQLDQYDGPKATASTIRSTLPDLTFENNELLDAGKPVVKIHEEHGSLSYVDYLDLFGFTNRRGFFEGGVHSYSEFYDDHAKLQIKQHYNNQHQPVITCYYHGGADNQAILTMIHLETGSQAFQFQSVAAFRAHFLDDLTQNDDTLICDREDYWGKALGLMHKNPRRMLVIHAAFTTNAKRDGEVFTSIKDTIEHGQLDDIITSTQAEADDIHARFPDVPTEVIPVTAVSDKRLTTHYPFETRTPFQIIAVARVTEIKQLSHAINAVIKLHGHFPEVDFKIYGYEDLLNGYAESKDLRKIVSQNNATDYVHFMGFTKDLSKIYQKADLLLLTSRSEGFSMAILEALSYACPVVSYDINYGPNELVKPGENGQLVPANDEYTLFRTLMAIFEDRQQLREYGRFAQKSVSGLGESKVEARWHKLLNSK
ncbi:glycosyltransferase [Secundilactobacillus mixtipabuli]|uniref:Poly(Glycerol-phosphate) alpha-glucosyltransferase n=1 Tax=Secundilactobacillus mixtipabuli TaxID=1435342 RepID=A0A1Z5IC40_9LACO|nr:glycosyltransferase [Secundilactobacillus mixtipabuli]GAW99205.1 poly(glycerol-phosphate) alpha-glucosyltransferase [Secundilactobacillus mixtipabuli]